MLTDFASVLIFLILSVAFVGLALGAAALLRRSNPTEEKITSYECGEKPVGTAWIQFNIRFFIIALVFIIFAVEIACIYPCAVIFRDWVAAGEGLHAVVEIFLFVLVLMLGLVYVWSKGDLEWIKSARHQEQERARQIAEARQASLQEAKAKS